MLDVKAGDWVRQDGGLWRRVKQATEQRVDCDRAYLDGYEEPNTVSIKVANIIERWRNVPIEGCEIPGCGEERCNWSSRVLCSAHATKWCETELGWPDFIAAERAKLSGSIKSKTCQQPRPIQIGDEVRCDECGQVDIVRLLSIATRAVFSMGIPLNAPACSEPPSR